VQVGGDCGNDDYKIVIITIINISNDNIIITIIYYCYFYYFCYYFSTPQVPEYDTNSIVTNLRCKFRRVNNDQIVILIIKLLHSNKLQ